MAADEGTAGHEVEGKARSLSVYAAIRAVLRAAVRPSRGQQGPRFWRRELLLAAVVLPSAVSFAANAVGARMFGLQLFGLWVFWRGAIQLTANITPGFNVGVTVLLPRYHKSGNRDLLEMSHWVADRAALAWGGLALLVAACVTFYVLDQPTTVIWALVALWGGTFFSGYTESVARGRRDGAAILAGSVANVIGASICILMAFIGSFAGFVWTQAARWWLRGLVQYRPARPGGGTVNWTDAREQFLELVRVGFPLTVRGWVQSAAQYGDRIVIGSVFGAAVVGATGLGSMLALPSVMLASTAGAWLLPILIAGGNDQAEAAFEHEIITIGIAILGGAFLLPLYPYVVPEAAPDMELLVLAYLVVCQLSLLIPILTPMIAAGHIWQAAGLHGLVVGAIALTIVATGIVGLVPELSLSLAAVVGFAAVGWVVLMVPVWDFENSRVSRGKLAGVALVTIVILIGYSKVSTTVSNEPVVAFPLGVVGASLAVVAAWRVFSRPSMETAIPSEESRGEGGVLPRQA